MVALVLLLSLHVHRQAGLTLPNPWNDEPWNLWPAKALVETGSFVTPELNPERPTMLYGGGYAAAAGLFMKAAGFSLETARWFSWVCMAGVWILTALMLAALPWRHAGVAVAGLFFLAPVHVVAGNVARPEALVLLLVTLGYWSLMKRRPIPAIFLCGLGVIVHPNALYFLLGAVLYVAVDPRQWRRLWPLTRTDWAVAIGCSLPVLLSAWMIGRIWEHWFGFFQIQIAHNVTYDPVGKLADFRWWLVLLGGLCLAARRFRSPAAVWLLYGLAALMVFLMGGEMWYEIYKITGFMAMLTGGAALLVHAGRAGAARWPVRRIPIAVVSGAAALLYLWGLGQFNYRHGFVTGPRNYPQKLSWGWGMTMADPEVPYITAADKQAVVALAMAAAGDHPAPVIEFPGTGDSFLFIDALPASARPFLRIRNQSESHVMVFHLSRYIPKWVQKGIRLRMEGMGIEVDAPDLVRHGTEKWYVRAVAPVEEGPGPDPAR